MTLKAKTMTLKTKAKATTRKAKAETKNVRKCHISHLTKACTVYLAKHLEISSNIDMFHQGWGLSPGMYIEWGFLSGGYNLGFNLRGGGISRGLSPAFDIWSNNIYGLLVGILELWSRRALSERKPPPRQLYNPDPGVT